MQYVLKERIDELVAQSTTYRECFDAFYQEKPKTVEELVNINKQIDRTIDRFSVDLKRSDDLFADASDAYEKADKQNTSPEIISKLDEYRSTSYNILEFMERMNEKFIMLSDDFQERLNEIAWVMQRDRLTIEKMVSAVYQTS